MTETNGKRKSPETWLAKLSERQRATLRVYVGAAPGVGKTWQMLLDAGKLFLDCAGAALVE